MKITCTKLVENEANGDSGTPSLIPRGIQKKRELIGLRKRM